MTSIRQIKPYPVRMEDELREALQASAKANARSLHSEILERLRASCDLPAPITEKEKTMRQIAKEEIEKALKK
jgi:L-fucose isomerase-like protein